MQEWGGGDAEGRTGRGAFQTGDGRAGRDGKGARAGGPEPAAQRRCSSQRKGQLVDALGALGGRKLNAALLGTHPPSRRPQ